jgi:hypothetical protein
LTIEDACEIICHAKSYRTADESKQAVNELAIASHLQAALQFICEAEVLVKNGDIHV